MSCTSETIGSLLLLAVGGITGLIFYIALI